MYVLDPDDKALLPFRKAAEEEEPPPDPREKFWEEAVERGRHVGMPERLYTQVCRFGPNGLHISMAPDCPHFDQEDETGKITAQGWTVQSGNQHNS